MKGLVFLGALLLMACTRDEPKPAPAPAPAPSEANPFARTYPFASATITYTKKDGTLTEVTKIKGVKKRTETTGGMWASENYRLHDADGEYNVLPKERKIIVFRSDAQHLFEAYKTLPADKQQQVQKSLAILGPDIPYYVEETPVFTGEREFGMLHGRCYHLTPRFALATSDVCYARGIKLSTVGENPIDPSARLDAIAVVQLNTPLDDALFTLPADFTRETASTDEAMHGVFRNLVERMEKPDFALANVQRQIGISK